MRACGIQDSFGWTFADTEVAHDAWTRQVAARRERRLPKRPVADILIGAFASRFDGLVTRNPEDFRALFPHLPLLDPTR